MSRDDGSAGERKKIVKIDFSEMYTQFSIFIFYHIRSRNAECSTFMELYVNDRSFINLELIFN